MYESVFQLRERPFCYAPRTNLYCPASAIESAYQTAARCIERAAGPVLLIGGPGTGKSLLCLRLAEQFRDRFHLAILCNAQLCTRRDLLQSILFELDLPYRGLEEGELRLSLIDFLAPARSSREGLLLLVDEAHTLPLRLMEELRMITNLVRDGQPRVRLVLAGAPILEDHFANPKLECFNQRIAARCYLQPLNFDETCQYVRSQLAAVGGNPDQLFTGAALQSVHHATDGIPRLINQVCDQALLLAAVGGHRQLDAVQIQEAWADLQQLPTPWLGTAQETSTDPNVIEFGSLDEQPLAEVLPPEDSDLRLAEEEDAEDREVVDLVEQLDDLQQQVAALTEEAATAAVSAPPPATLLLTTGVEPDEEKATRQTASTAFADLFAEDFEHEEIVIDRYAALEAASLWFEPVADATSPAQEAEPVSLAATALSDGAEDWSNRAKVIRVLPPDDNDLIMIVDDERRTAGDHSTRRQEYRQLFSRLRQS
ncbi:MAG: AAA family ATPase [Planctomycetota bacterium]|nr:AAA family ATPase [Planctomycetota bacterium]